jgi:hypothetical protein
MGPFDRHPVYIAAQWLQGKIHRYERRLLPDAVRELTEALWPEQECPARAARHPRTAAAQIHADLRATDPIKTVMLSDGERA